MTPKLPSSLKETIEEWLNTKDYTIEEVDYETMLLHETTLSEIIETKKPLNNTDSLIIENITGINHKHWLKIDKHYWNSINNRQP